ncbi:hypothetical protein HDV57DRAFT_477633 [Trichoderma longibrachiatum]|uniref:Infection structure specific protein n=1 Tax=Trichoderma longibrachiatum ATCC 18648 TaxID=983965 RepID=A0A2T4C6A5_TRILO|nr:hypothetical protein M440DRAFT_1401432 [Trichoderma longibrachiatum ATCC 18648]
MSSNRALLLLTLAASASAAIDYMAIPQVRDLLPAPTPISRINNLARDASNDAECASSALDLLQSIPTPPPALLSDLSKSVESQQTDPCKMSFPASLSADVSSYSSEVLSWYSGHEAELTSLAKECTAAQSYTGLVNVCTKDGSSGSGSSGASETTASAPSSGTAGAATKTAGASTATSTNAGAARETGMAFAALAAAGIAALL